MHKNVFNTLQNRLNENQLRLNSINHEKSCVWLTSYPINDHGFGLTKQQYPANNECNDVEIEPKLLLFIGENFSNRTANTRTETRLDIRSWGFWVRGQQELVR